MSDINYENGTMKVIIDGKKRWRQIDVASMSSLPEPGDAKPMDCPKMLRPKPLLAENEFLVKTMKDSLYHILKK